MSSSISVENLTKVYDLGEIQVRALRGVTVDIDQGEFVAVIGPSGSGKSTFMHILGCLDRPNSGRYVLDGSDVSRLSRTALAAVRNKKIGFVFQGFNLLSRTTALDNVELPLLYDGTGMRGKERHRRAKEALESVGLSDRAGHHPNQLSGGQQHRLASARAVLGSPEILIFDEATSSLDTVSERQVQAAMDSVSQNRTVIVIAHRISTIKNADKIIVIDNGQIVEEGTHDELIERKGQFARLAGVGS